MAAGIVLVQEAGGWTNEFFAGDGLEKGNPSSRRRRESATNLLAISALEGWRQRSEATVDADAQTHYDRPASVNFGKPR